MQSGGKRSDVIYFCYERTHKRLSDIPDSPHQTTRRKKDRKRWCGGRVGREHIKESVSWLKWLGHLNTPQDSEDQWSRKARNKKVIVCARCGKMLS